MRDVAASKTLSPPAPLGEFRAHENIADIAKVLNQCLAMLDALGMHQAAAHLSEAIEVLPGQTAALPIEETDLPDGPASA